MRDELAVERGDLAPVGRVRGRGRSRGTRRSPPGPGTDPVGRAGARASSSRRPSSIAARVPPRAVLLLERDQVAGGVDAGRAARVVQQHQREQAERLGLVGHELGERATETDGLGRELGADEVGAGRSPRTPR